MPCLRAEALKPRLALAVVPSLDAGTLHITLDAADDHAVLSRVGEKYAVYGQSEVGSFPVQRVTRVVVNGSPATGQSFTIASGGGWPITAALFVDESVESTKLRAPIVTSGDVVVESPAITLAGQVNTKGLQRYVGAVTVDPAVRGVIPLPRDTFDWIIGEDSMVVSQTGNVLLARSWFGQSVAIVDTRKTSLIANVPLPLLPVGIAVTADGSRGFVSHDLVEDVGGIARPQVAVSVIDVAGQRVSRTVAVGAEGNVAGMAVSPDGKRVYAVCDSIDQRPSSLVVIDTDRLTIETTIALPLPPWHRVQSILVSGDGKQVYVVDAGVNSGGFLQTFIDPSITVVDATTNAVTGTIDLGVFGPGGLADCRLGSDGKTAYAISFSGVVGVVDLARMTLTKTFTPVGEGQNVRLAPNSDGLVLRLIAPGGLATRMVDVRIADGEVVTSRSVPAAGNIVLAPGTNRTFLRIDSGIAVVDGSSPGTGVLTIQGASVAFDSRVDGSAGLEVLCAGATTFAAAVGSGSPLGSLVTDRRGSVSLHSVATSGIQRYADAAVQLSGDFSVTKPVVSGEAFAVLGRTTLVSNCTVRAVGGRVAFQGTVNGVASLTVDGRATAPGGVTDVVFRQRVGGGVPLVSMSFVGLAGAVSDRAVSVNGRGFWDAPVGISIDKVKRVRLTTPGSEIRGIWGCGMVLGSDGGDVIISGFRIAENSVGVVLKEGNLSRTRIIGNTIEANSSASTVSGPGILVEGRGALIQGNVIRGNDGAGIELSGPNASATLLSNSIAGNGPTWTVLPERGIVAAEEAVTPPAPTVQSIERVRGVVRITVKSNLPASATLRFQLFANRVPPGAGDADVAGLVQGERLIADVVRGASNGTTTISIPARSLPAGEWVTVTATTTRPGEAGNTSCFSRAVRAP